MSLSIEQSKKTSLGILLEASTCPINYRWARISPVKLHQQEGTEWKVSLNPGFSSQISELFPQRHVLTDKLSHKHTHAFPV